jgi:hypothetical protein
MIRRLLSALRLHNRQPQEPPRTANHAHADPAAPGVHLRGVLDAGTGHGAAGVVQHEGATEDWSPLADFADRQPTGAGSVPETRAMRLEADRVLHDALSEVEARLRAAYDEWWSEFLARLGIDEGDLTAVKSFADATKLAGVIALPAEPVDWTTAEWAVVS